MNNLYEIRRKVKFWRPELVYLLLADRDKNVRNLLKEQVASAYLKDRYVDKYFSELGEVKGCKSQSSIPHICWIYWKQGIDNAPDIIKCCVQSLKTLFLKNCWSVNVLDLSEARNLTDIPLYIWEKYEKGMICEAHFSDIIRISLLENYGGVWMDATVYSSENEIIPDFLISSDFFAYRNFMKNDSYINISNWLLAASKKQIFIKHMKAILYEYWKKENTSIQYYMFHIIFKLVTDQEKELWDSYPTYSNVPPHIMQDELFKKITDKRKKELCEISPLHKLRWRVPDIIEQDCLYEMLIKDELK